MVFESIELWAPSFWLPPNVTWDDMERVQGKHQIDPFYQEFLYPIPIALAIALLRYVTERYVFLPTGRYFKVKETTEKAEHNALLQEAFEKSSRINKEKALRLAKQSDWTEEQVRRWWSRRSNQDLPSEMYKFCESSWESSIYIFSFSFGVVVLWNKPWVWNSVDCFSEIPYEITPDLWWYYLFASGNYYALTISFLKEYKRTDFWATFIHHLVTIFLLSMSRISNLQRIGIIVMVLHDCGDIYYELSKLARYTGYQQLCHVLLIFYTVLWIIMRLYLLPSHIVFSLFISPYNFPAIAIMRWLLVILVCFHVYWTCRILQLLHKVFFEKKAQKDDSHHQSKSEHQTTIARNKEQTIWNGTRRKVEQISATCILASSRDRREI